MSDEPTAPFTFRPAPAKPSRKTTLEKVEHMSEQVPGEIPHGYASAEAEPAKRKRRTRVEMAQTSAPGDDMAVLKSCLKQLRTLPPETAARVVATLEVVFK